MPALPKLNVSEPAVREYLWSVAEHWLRFGIDGWRLDVPAEIDDPPFWAELRRRCRAINPEAYLVGEIWHVAPEWVAGDRFDALMNYPLAEAIIGFVGGRSLNEALLRSHNEYRKITGLDGAGFAGRLMDLLAAYAPETNAAQLNLLDSHDTPRVLSVLGGDRDAVELAVLLQATLPGAPCVYYGGEVGLAGGMDPDSRRAMPWDESHWDHELLDAIRATFAVRHAEPALRADPVRVISAVGEALAFQRDGPGGPLAVALNAGDEPIELALGEGAAASEIVHVVGRARGSTARLAQADGVTMLGLPARSGAVVRLA
jgi:cyclomaltodextrinase / maltogenic alpha-amylase / neopullulanase